MTCCHGGFFLRPAYSFSECEGKHNRKILTNLMTYELHLGDCKEIIPTLKTKFDALVCDPPYGISNDCDYSRFTNGIIPSKTHPQIKNDQHPFDPQHLLDLNIKRMAIFGYNNFADKLPKGSLLIWVKRPISAIGKFCGDCEVCWTNRGHGIFLYHHVWHGFVRESERGKSLHPTQKPVALIKWVLDKLKVPEGATVLDPYAGSGSIGVACLQTGRKFVGIELDEQHYKTARQRLDKANDQT